MAISISFVCPFFEWPYPDFYSPFFDRKLNFETLEKNWRQLIQSPIQAIQICICTIQSAEERRPNLAQ